MSLMELFQDAFEAGREARQKDRREMHSTGDASLLAKEGWEEDDNEAADKDLSVRTTESEAEAYDA